jgi:hypothetical protein
MIRRTPPRAVFMITFVAWDLADVEAYYRCVNMCADATKTWQTMG